MRRSLQKLFCLCIVLAMVLSMVPAADVSAAAGTAWSGGAFSKSGEYYLTGDITISEAITLNSSREVTLDLNGHTITVAAGVRAFYLNGGKLTIKDSGEGGTIQASNTEFSGRGGIIYVKGSAAVLTLESGTITGGSATERGGNIYVESGMFNMTGGTISGGKVGDRGGNIASTGKVNISGGIITGGQATSYGGNILTTGANCYVNLSGTAQITDGVSKNGGNIMLMYSNLNISGGTISGGVATSYGANVHTYGTESSHCSFTMSGGLIGNAGAAATVSSIYLTGPAANKCLVNISGGTIQGRVIANATGSITLSGAPVIENLYLNAGNLVTPSGLTAGADISVSVASGYTGISGLVTNASQYLPYFSSYTAGYGVGVVNNRLTLVPGCTCGCGVAPENITWKDLSGYTGGELPGGHYFVPEAGITLTEQFTVASGEEVTIDLRGSTIRAAENARAFYLSGKLSIIDSGEDETGKVIGGTLTGSSYGGTIYLTTGGQFYLYSGTITGGTADRGGNLYIAIADNVVELHGGVISDGTATASSSTTGRGGNIYMNKGTLTITGNALVTGGDAQRWVMPEGTSGANNSARGGNLWVTGGDCYINGNAVLSEGHAGYYGGNAMFYTCNAELGGNAQIIAGDADKYGNNIVTMNANVTFKDNVYVDAAENGTCSTSTYFHDTGSGTSITNVVTIAGGKLEGTTQVSKVIELHLSGKPVISYLNVLTGMMATSVALTDGADITLKVADGTFTDAFEEASQNVGYFKPYQSGYAVAVEENTLVYGKGCSCGCGDLDTNVGWTSWAGKAITKSGHYRLSKDMTLSDVITIEEGLNVAIDLNSKTLTAAASSRVFVVKGNLTLMDSGSGGTVTGGVATGSVTDGGNVYIADGGVFTLLSGTITGGTADRYAGNVLVASGAKFEMKGGTIQDGTSGTRGGNIYVSTAQMYMHAGTITNGTTADRGGNLFTNGGVVYIMGGSVTGGTTTGSSSSTYGGNLMATGVEAAIHISGNAKITNGTAGTGSTIALMYSNLYVSGGTIQGGKIYATESGSQTYSGLYFSGGTITCDAITVAGDASDGRGSLVAITGGTFTGNFHIASAVNVILSGAPSLAKLTLDTDVQITPVNIASGTVIPLEATGAFTTVLENADSYIKHFSPASGSIINENGVLVVRATAASGTSGNIKWSVSTDGVLTITGSGSMSNYYYYSSNLSSIPWKSYLSSIKKVVVGEGVTSLGNNSFYNCSSLETVVLPSSLTSIGEAAFSGCSKLETVTIPGNVKTIGKNAFKATNLTEISIPNSVTTINQYAFQNCASLTTVNLGTGLTSIGNNAFSGCSALQVVNYSGTQSQWDNISVGSNNTSLTEATVNYDHSNGGVTFSSMVWSINSTGVLTITGTGEMPGYYKQSTYSNFRGAPWLEFANQITAVEINGFTSIGDWAFYNLDNLTTIAIPGSVTRIEANAFRDCDKLTSITIPDTVTWIGENAFFSCDALQTVSMGVEVCNIGSYAFYNCDALTDVTIPASVVNVGAMAFAECNSLTGIAVADANDYYASANGSLLNKEQTTLIQVPAGINGSYITPETVTTIGDNAFEGCNTLNDVVITDNVQTIGNGAFFGTSVTTVTLGRGVSSIANNAFNDCDNLLSFSLSSTNAAYAVDTVGALYTADGLTLVQVPAGLSGVYTVANTATTVGSKAMAWNDTVTQVVLSGSVTSVAEYAFTGAAFKTLDMTASVTSIGKGATECAGLKTVNYTGTEQTWLEMTIGKYNNPLNNAKINRTTGGVLNENIRWDVANNGVLTITGTGELPVYKAGLAPWYVNCTGVTAIVISDGITGISANAFYGCTNVNEVYLPATLQTVGENAFVSSNSIAAVSYAGTQFQWAAVTVGNGNTGLTSAKFIYNAAVLTAIQVKTLPSKLEYNLGDTVADTTGIVLTLIYNDGSTEEVSELTADYVVTVDASQMGNGMVTITYKNKTATYMVDVIAAGTCGENVTWTLKDGVLTLSGEGEMTYYAAKTEVPWWDMKTEITTLVVEEGITGSISKFAFYDCVNMTSATLPEGITFLGSSAFYNCSSLTEIDIPDSVTGISSTVFGKNTALTTVAFGENMTSIGDGAFRECTGLTTVNYGGSRVTWAAMDISTTENDALLNATINYAIALPVAAKVTQAPDKVQYVPGEVVDTTGMLLSIVYDDGSEQPYDGEFTLSDNTVAAGMTTIYVTAGEFTTSFRIEVMPGGVTEEGIRWYVDNGKLYIDYSGAMPDYSSLNPAPWVQTYEESDYWFSKVEFLGDITYIGSYTFDGCYDVYNLALPESVTAIGDYAFCGMSSLEELAFGVNVTTIGTGVLNYCDCMMNLYYGGNSVTWNRIAMGEDNEEFDLFDFNYGMHEPDGVRVVSMPNKTQYLYWESLDLTGLVLEYYYGDYDITTPYEDGYVVFDGLVDIGENLIYLETIDCYPVTLQVTMLPSGYCGAEGDNLRWSLVDGKLTISGEGEMFYYDTKADVPWWNYKETVTSAEVEAGMTGRLTRFAFYNCVNMESASLPEGVTFLGSSAFFGCSSLKEIVIPNTVTGMSSTVFGENRSLTTVTFGESVEEIGSGAFRDCDSLTTVNYGGSRTTWANISINATDNDALHNAKINYARVDLTSVEITAQPTKLSYLLGEELDTTGLELTAHYDDGSSLVVTDFTAEADMTQVGVVIVTVSYGGKTAQYTIGIGYGGYTEDGLFWQYADGVLTVDYVVDAENPGTGVMQDYTEEIPAPWSDLAAEIQNIIVGEGVSAIGAYAFYNCGEMTAVILPLSLTAIGENAFLACDKLEVVTYVGSDDQWKAVNIAKTGNEKLLEIAPQFTAMLGDINEDGAVDTLDLLALQAHLSGKMKDIFVEAADVNVDGTVDTLDLLALQAYLSGKITNF